MGLISEFFSEKLKNTKGNNVLSNLCIVKHRLQVCLWLVTVHLLTLGRAALRR